MSGDAKDVRIIQRANREKRNSQLNPNAKEFVMNEEVPTNNICFGIYLNEYEMQSQIQLGTYLLHAQSACYIYRCRLKAIAMKTDLKYILY